MCLEKTERTNFLRLVCLFIDIGTEALITIFLHLIPNRNIVTFFSSDEVRTKVQALGKRKILSKKQIKIVFHSNPNSSEFDISLLIALLSNLFPGDLFPPAGGWQTNRPRNDDLSVAADIIRIRLLRNTIVGHSSRARLSDTSFKELWGELETTVIRIYTSVEPNDIRDISKRIENYKTMNLDAQGEIYEDKLRELRDTCKEIVEIQEKVADLLKKSQEFERFFRSTPTRFSRYIKLLFNGGRLVITAYLHKLLSKGKVTIQTVLLDKKSNLEKFIGASETAKLTNATFENWDIQVIATVVLVCFERKLKQGVKKAIVGIQEALQGYANSALESLDADKFSHIAEDLIYNLGILSGGLEDDVQIRCKECIDIYRRKESGYETETEEQFGLLKSYGLKFKSLEDVYKETLIQLKQIMKEMEEKEIPFKSDYILQLQLMTNGEQKKMAEDILTTVIKAALTQTDSQTKYEDIRNAVDIILDQINKMSDVKVENVERHCIIISIHCSSILGLSQLIEYVESTLFQEQLCVLSTELMALLGEVPVVSGNFNFENLNDLFVFLSDCHKTEHVPEGVTVPIICKSAKGMHQLSRLMSTSTTTNSVNQIAEQLSVHVQDNISLQVVIPELEHISKEYADNETKQSSTEPKSHTLLEPETAADLKPTSKESLCEASPGKYDDVIPMMSKQLEKQVTQLEKLMSDNFRSLDERLKQIESKLTNAPQHSEAVKIPKLSKSQLEKAVEKIENEMIEKIQRLEKRYTDHIEQIEINVKKTFSARTESLTHFHRKCQENIEAALEKSEKETSVKIRHLEKDREGHLDQVVKSLRTTFSSRVDSFTQSQKKFQDNFGAALEKFEQEMIEKIQRKSREKHFEHAEMKSNSRINSLKVNEKETERIQKKTLELLTKLEKATEEKEQKKRLKDPMREMVQSVKVNVGGKKESEQGAEAGLPKLRPE